MADSKADAAMVRVRTLFEASNLSLQNLGEKMGYPEGTARMSAWQFMKTSDPRISMLRKFARALDIPLADLVEEKKGRGK